ncbi:hypothetical protein V8F06_009584 [Rhypophila decipiens]
MHSVHSNTAETAIRQPPLLNLNPLDLAQPTKQYNMGSNNPKRSVPFGFNTPAPQSSDDNMTDISNRIRYLEESLRSAGIAVQKQQYEVYRALARSSLFGPGPHSQALSSKLELERSHLKSLELVVSDFKTKIEYLSWVKLNQHERDKMEVRRLHTSSVEDNTSDDGIDGMNTPSTTTGTADWDDDIGSRPSEQGETASADLKDSEEGETKPADCDSATSPREEGPGKAEAEAPTMQRLWMYGPVAVAEARPPKDQQPAILSEPRCFRAVKTHIGGSHAEAIVKKGDIFMVCGVLSQAPEVLIGYNPHNLTVGELPASSLETVPADDLDLYSPYDQVLPSRYKSSIWMAREDFAADQGGDDESDSASSSSDNDDEEDDDDDYKPYSGTLTWQEGDYVRMYHDFEKFIPRAPTGEDGSVKKPKVARPWDDCEMRVGFNLRTKQFGYFAGWSEDGWRFVDGDI